MSRQEITTIRRELRDYLEDIRDIAKDADDARRDFTATERARVDELQAKVEDAKERLEKAETKYAIDHLGRDLAGVGAGPGDSESQASASSLGLRPAHSAKYSPQPGRSAWTKAALGAFRRVHDVTGNKAAISGALAVPAPVGTSQLILPEHPMTILDLILDRQSWPANTFSFVQYAAMPNNAAPVADGATKPTSPGVPQEVEDRMRTIAHLSSPILERLFADYSELEEFLALEMEAGVLRAFEQQIITGDGTGENMTGVIHTSGTLAQPFVSDPWTSIRKGITALRSIDVQPTAIALNPDDAETFDLTREGEDGGFLLTNVADVPNNITQRLPRVESTAVPAGTAIVGDWRLLRLYIREEARVDVDRSGDNLFDKNLAKVRVEMRGGLAVRRPSAFVTVDLTA